MTTAIDNNVTPFRARALQQLRGLIPELIARITQNTSVKRDDFECQLQPFGSYGLGGYITGADIDLVFLGAAPVRRKQFFNTFPHLLKRTSRVANVEVSHDPSSSRTSHLIYVYPKGHTTYSCTYHQIRVRWIFGTCDG